jgi:hypothetical protein
MANQTQIWYDLHLGDTKCSNRDLGHLFLSRVNDSQFQIECIIEDASRNLEENANAAKYTK